MDTPGDIGPATVEEDERESEPPQRLTLEVVIEGGNWPADEILRALVARAGDALQAAPELAHMLERPVSACIAFATDADVQVLNKQFRGMDKPTNVLSFPAHAPPADIIGVDEPMPLGDVVLAAETVASEARELDIPVSHHVQHLVVHGLLHLLGHDHETDTDAELMEALETRALAALGVPDPYRSNE